MGKKVLEQVFGEKPELIDRTIDLIRRCFRTAQPKESSLTNLTARMERLKAKKNTLLEMRTEGEITKEEFLEHRQNLDGSHTTTRDMVVEGRKNNAAVFFTPEDGDGPVVIPLPEEDDEDPDRRNAYPSALLHRLPSRAKINPS